MKQGSATELFFLSCHRHLCMLKNQQGGHFKCIGMDHVKAAKVGREVSSLQKLSGKGAALEGQVQSPLAAHLGSL